MPTATGTETPSGLASDLAESKNRLATDFKNLVSDAEALLRVTGNYTGEGVAQARARFEDRLNEIKGAMSEMQSVAFDKYKEAADNADRYVRDNPWQAVGIAAAVGILVGFLTTRR